MFTQPDCVCVWGGGGGGAPAGLAVAQKAHRNDAGQHRSSRSSSATAPMSSAGCTRLRFREGTGEVRLARRLKRDSTAGLAAAAAWPSATAVATARAEWRMSATLSASARCSCRC